MQKIWFRAKYYGWGWYPVTKEGGLTMLVWTMFFASGEIVFIERIKASGDGREIAWFVPYVLLITGILIYITWKKGEPPHWAWGKRE